VLCCCARIATVFPNCDNIKIQSKERATRERTIAERETTEKQQRNRIGARVQQKTAKEKKREKGKSVAEQTSTSTLNFVFRFSVYPFRDSLETL
jgi:hypothetical protein